MKIDFISNDCFIANLRACSLITPKKDIRSYLCGIYLEFTAKSMRITATDGKRILVSVLDDSDISIIEDENKPSADSAFSLSNSDDESKNNDRSLAEPFGFILPIGSVKPLIDAIEATSPHSIRVDTDKNTITVSEVCLITKSETVVFSCKGIDGKYPCIQRVISQDDAEKHSAVISSDFLADAHKIEKELGKAYMNKFQRKEPAFRLSFTSGMAQVSFPSMPQTLYLFMLRYDDDRAKETLPLAKDVRNPILQFGF